MDKLNKKIKMKKPKIIKLGTNIGIERTTIKNGIKNTSIQIMYEGNVPKGRLMKKSKIVCTLRLTKRQMGVLTGVCLFAYRQLQKFDANVDFTLEDLEQLGYVINAQDQKGKSVRELKKDAENVCLHIDELEVYGTAKPKRTN